MPEQHKKALHDQLKMMPIAKQEQLIAELVETNKRRESMTEEERAAEDAENKQLSEEFTALMNSMDQQ